MDSSAGNVGSWSHGADGNKQTSELTSPLAFPFCIRTPGRIHQGAKDARKIDMSPIADRMQELGVLNLTVWRRMEGEVRRETTSEPSATRSSPSAHTDQTGSASVLLDAENISQTSKAVLTEAVAAGR